MLLTKYVGHFTKGISFDSAGGPDFESVPGIPAINGRPTNGQKRQNG